LVTVVFMRRGLLIVLIAICLASLLAAGCTQPTQGGNETATPTVAPASGPRTITDLNGNVVTLPENIDSVAVLTSPPVQIMYVLGAEDMLTVVTQQTQKAPMLLKIDPRVKDMPAPRAGEVNLEELLKGNPDICMGGSTDMAGIRKGTNLTAIDVISNTDSSTTKSIENQVLFMGSVLGKEDRANYYVNYTEGKLNLLKQKTSQIPESQRLKVFLGLTANKLNTYGGQSYMQERIESAGLLNAAKDLAPLTGQYSSGYQEVSLETVNLWNPDIIIIDDGTPDDLYNNPQWANINAVKNHRVYRMPTGIFIWSRPTAESAVLFPEWLAITAYPEQFADLNMSNEIRSFYSEIFKYNLTGQDISDILNPKGNYMQGGSGTGTGTGNSTSK
jgi:iron complex transport system substrate-binding protein